MSSIVYTSDPVLPSWMNAIMLASGENRGVVREAVPRVSWVGATVESDVMRATDVANRLSAFAALGAAQPEPVDATGMLEQLLETRRGRIRERNLLVLTELDHDRPLVFADAAHLRFALEAVIDQALELCRAL